MSKFLLAALITLSAVSSFAQERDLELPGERWLAAFTHFVCADGNTAAAEIPSQLAAINAVFGRFTTDYSLDNALVKATFEENGIACNYSAILNADNAANTISLVDSKAFSVNDSMEECAEGKAVLDATLAFNPYVYLHGRIAIPVAAANAEAACGAGSETIGFHFQARGRLQ